MKAEWRASRRVIGALCAVVLISGALLGLMGNVLLREGTGSWQLPDFVNVLFSLLSMTAMLAVTLSLAASVFYVLWRYYRSRFTEEGYLTYTLPVNNHQLMLSSILASVLEILLVGLATVAAMAIAFGIFAAELPWNEVDRGLVWSRFRELLSLRPVAGDVLLVLLNMVLMGLAALLTLMLAVTIGATAAKKHPILLAIAVYYGLSLVRMAAYLNAADACTSSGATLAALAGVNAAAMLIAYFWMYYLTSRRLNLN
jgi:membrane protein